MFQFGELVWVVEDEYQFVGQVAGLMTTRDTIFIRRAPGDPTTVCEVSIENLIKRSKGDSPVHFVHYASVFGRGHFPIDLLRNDNAAPINFRLIPIVHSKENAYNVIMVDSPYTRDAKLIGDNGTLPLVVAKSARTRYEQAWMEIRWAAYGWGVRHFHVAPIVTQ